MLLLIDVGNTRVKWGVPEDAKVAPTSVGAVRWRHAGVTAHGDIAQLAQAWQSLPISRVLLSNVAGAVLGERLQTILHSVFGAQLALAWLSSQAELAGLRNAYRDPAQLGCDRFASALGARALFGQQALLVVTCGTATTVDAISAAGDFIGGMILPGLGMMASALALNTAQLPHIQTLASLTTPFADNTADAIIAGCIAAQVGAIERAAVAHRAQQGELLCVLSGGAGAVLAPYLAQPCQIVDNLVLIGLHVVASASDPAFIPFPSC